MLSAPDSGPSGTGNISNENQDAIVFSEKVNGILPLPVFPGFTREMDKYSSNPNHNWPLSREAFGVRRIPALWIVSRL